MILRWPSTSWVSLVNACMLSRVLALATLALAFACCFFVAVPFSSSKILSTSMWAYQTSRLRVGGELLHPGAVLGDAGKDDRAAVRAARTRGHGRRSRSSPRAA